MMHIILLFAAFGTPAHADVPILVKATSLNLRTASGSILCEVKPADGLVATGRADGDWIKVKVNKAGCPKEGFVHSAYVTPKASTVASRNGARVETEGLSLRRKPNTDEENFECALPKNTQLELANEKSAYDKDAELTFVKVKIKNPVKGCPGEGWVAKLFLKSVTDVTTVTGNLASLPVITRLAAKSDNVADCNGAGCNKQIKADSAISQMDKVSSGIGRKIDDEAPPRPPMPVPTSESCARKVILAAAKDSVKSQWGNRSNSGGLCAYGVRLSLQRVRPLGVNGALGNAIDFRSSLKRLGFTDSNIKDPNQAPPGSVIVFDGPRSSEYLRTGYEGTRGHKGNWLGHVTIKGDDGFYYTDGRTREPALGWSRGRNVSHIRNVVGIYVPGPSLERKFAGQCR